MNPLRLLVLLISLPLLLGGCGEKPVAEVKEEVKPEEPVAETKPKTEGVNLEELEFREGFYYLLDSDTPYTGKSFALWKNGQKAEEGNYKDGKPDGLVVGWYKNGKKQFESNYKDGKGDGLWTHWNENGQKFSEINFKDGEEVEGSRKYWNSKGEPVATAAESRK